MANERGAVVSKHSRGEIEVNGRIEKTGEDQG